MSETDNFQLPIDVSFLLSSAFESVIFRLNVTSFTFSSLHSDCL